MPLIKARISLKSFLKYILYFQIVSQYLGVTDYSIYYGNVSCLRSSSIFFSSSKCNNSHMVYANTHILAHICMRAACCSVTVRHCFSKASAQLYTICIKQNQVQLYTLHLKLLIRISLCLLLDCKYFSLPPWSQAYGAMGAEGCVFDRCLVKFICACVL